MTGERESQPRDGQLAGQVAVVTGGASGIGYGIAEVLASRAENVSIFFADLFGYEQRFNVPGVIDNTANWSLRLPPDFDRLHRERLDRGAALDLHLACELALSAGTTPRRAGAP